MLLDLARSQYEFERIVAPFLYAGVEYNDDEQPTRWWPRGHSVQVVIDPARSFGAPIVPGEGVPTRVLYNGYAAEQSYDFVAAWFDVDVAAVHDAVSFELSMAS